MRKYIWGVLFFSIVLSVNAQTEKEDTNFNPTAKEKFLIGASSNFNFGFNNTTFRTDSTSVDIGDGFNLSLSISGGLFIVDNLAVGTGLSLGFLNADSASSESDQFMFALEPFVRYYFLKGKVRPFIEGNIGFGGASGDITFTTQVDDIIQENENDIDLNFFNYGFSGGATFFLTDSFAIDLAIAYRRSRITDENANDFRTISSNIGLVAGFRFFL